LTLQATAIARLSLKRPVAQQLVADLNFGLGPAVTSAQHHAIDKAYQASRLAHNTVSARHHMCMVPCRSLGSTRLLQMKATQNIQKQGTAGWRPLSLCSFLLSLLLLLLQCLCLLHCQPLPPTAALCCFHVLNCCIVNLQASGECDIRAAYEGKQLSSRTKQLRVLLCRSCSLCKV
jgi:hypothetical protein